MDLDQRNTLLSLTFFCQGKSIEELRQMVICANVELQAARIQAQEEMRKRDEELRHIRNILSRAVKERDEAEEKLQKLLAEKFSHHQEVKHVLAAPVSGVTSNGFSSSEGDESIVSSPVLEPLPHLPRPQGEEMIELLMREKRPLPEKGKLLDAVLNAGPLLQTLLLAGPLPEWRHQPPPLESSQIPTVAVPSPSPLLPQMADYINCGRINRKRGLTENSASLLKTKHHKILLS